MSLATDQRRVMFIDPMPIEGQPETEMVDQHLPMDEDGNQAGIVLLRKNGVLTIWAAEVQVGLDGEPFAVVSDQSAEFYSDIHEARTAFRARAGIQ
jgi:hypothetical protein